MGARPVGPGRWSGMPVWFREAVARARAEHAARAAVAPAGAPSTAPWPEDAA